MAWRLHLTDRIVRRLDILNGKPSVLAAWTGADRVYFMELHNAGKLTEKMLEPPRTRATAMWGVFVKGLHGTNGTYLPVVRTPQGEIHQNEDGTIRVYCLTDTALSFEQGGSGTPLDTGGETIAALVLDGERTAALDKGGKLHLFQRAVHTGTVDTGLRVTEELQPYVVAADGGSRIFAADGEQIAAFDGDGRLIKRLHTGYMLGALACSPDGTMLVTSDLDANIIRVYDGRDLTPTHQRFALDLLADAKRTQSISSALAANTAVGALAINNKGVIAFAMSGMVCATNLTRLLALPGGKVSAVES